MRKIFLSIVLLLCCLICFGQNKAAMAEKYISNPSKALQDAQTSYSEGDYEKTINLIRIYNALSGKNDGNDIITKAQQCQQYLEKAKMFEEQGDSDSAAQCYRSILEINPNDPKAKSKAPIVSAPPSVYSPTLSTLTASHPAGTRGVYNGKEAIRVDLGGKKYVIATRNEGAKSETDYGDYYKFDEAVKKFSAGRAEYNATGLWRLPTKGELKTFAELPNSWTTDSGVNGRSFIVASGKTLFLPAAGYVSCFDGSLYYRGEGGDYWSSTSGGSGIAYNLFFNSGYCYVDNIGRTFGHSVRLFCALPSE